MRKLCAYCLMGIFVFVFVFSCANKDKDGLEKATKIMVPKKSFDETPVPEPPDYSDPKYWGCLPDRDGDPCDQVPKKSGLTNDQAKAAVDCFAVHPTTMYRSYGWNARLDDSLTNAITDRTTLKSQFSVYNGSTRVFAPYYRQAGLAVFGLEQGHPDQTAALQLATDDIIAAFQYYLDHYDTGNPIIIAGHSQGIRHAINVLKKYFDGEELQERLVAAYLIGGNLHTESFEFIEICNYPEQTGCALGWRTMEWGLQTNKPGELPKDIELVCVNPLSWKADEVWVDADKNLGGIPFGFKGVDPEVTDAKCDSGNLWIRPPKKRGYPALQGGNYHICDYSLFYMNIRKNIKTRIDSFQK
jgi:Protein of unknown function (DUF3089)